MTDNEVTVNEYQNHTGARSDGRVISTNTYVVGAILLLVLVAAVALDYLSSAGGVLSEYKDIALAALTLVPLGIALIILPVANSFAKGAIRTQWTLLGLGMLSVGIGNVVFIALYLVTGVDPYPSIADVFTLAGYALFAAALFSAVRSYRGLLDVRQPMLIATIVAGVAMAVVYFTVIGPYIIFAPDQTQSMATRIFNTLYPVLDMFLLLMPAITLGLLVGKLGTGRVAWPWWFVVASASILAVTDAVFAYAGYAGIGRTPIIDAGYAAAPLLLGVAVLVARDIYRS